MSLQTSSLLNAVKNPFLPRRDSPRSTKHIVSKGIPVSSSSATNPMEGLSFPLGVSPYPTSGSHLVPLQRASITSSIPPHVWNYWAKALWIIHWGYLKYQLCQRVIRVFVGKWSKQRFQIQGPDNVTPKSLLFLSPLVNATSRSHA